MRTQRITLRPGPSRTSVIGVAITVLSMVLFGLAVASNNWMSTNNSAQHTAPTSCLGEVHDENVSVDCHDPSAIYAVLGAVDRVSEAGFNADWRAICFNWPQATVAFWREYAWSEIGTSASGIGEVTCAVEVSRYGRERPW